MRPKRRPTEAPSTEATGARSTSTPTATARSCSASPPPDPRDDGAYYQALVDAANEFSEENGFGDPIVVDNIQAADAATALANLAQQGVDVDHRRRLRDRRAAARPDRASTPTSSGTATAAPASRRTRASPRARTTASEISYTAGYATGLLLQDSGRRQRRRSSAAATSASRSRRTWPSSSACRRSTRRYTMTYVPDRRLPVRLRQHRQRHRGAADGAIDERRRRRLPVPRRRPRAGRASSPTRPGLITMSAGSSTVVRARRTSTTTSPSSSTAATTSSRHGGDHRRHVPGGRHQACSRSASIREPGAVICDPTPEQQTAMDDVYAQIAAGDFAEQFGAIKGEAYAGG